jgi:hypothetical protein
MKKRKQQKQKIQRPPSGRWVCPKGHISLNEPARMTVTGMGKLEKGAIVIQPLGYFFCWMCVGEHISQQFPIKPEGT